MMKKEIQEKVLAAFKKEYKIHLEGIRAALAAHPEGTPLSAAALDTVKIRTHTLKGASKAASLPVVQDLARALEIIFERIKTGDITFNPDVRQRIETLLETTDRYVIAVMDPTQPIPDQEAASVLQTTHRFLGIAKEGSEEKAREEFPKKTIVKETIRQKVLAVFYQEYKVHLERIRRDLASMAKGKEPFPDEIDEAFREAHTLKGAARAADIPAVQTLAHRLETLFSRIKEKRQAVDKATVTLINTVLDAIEDYVVALPERGEADQPPLPAGILETIDGFLGLETVPREQPGVEIPSPLPKEAKEPPGAAPSPRLIDSLHIKAESLDRLQKTAGRIITENQRHTVLQDHIRSLETLLGEVRQEWGHLQRTSHTLLRQMEAEPGYLKVSGYINYVNHHVQRLDSQVRALKETQKSLRQAGNDLGEQLSKEIREARLIPAESVFQGFRKMVRDLAKDEGKQVEFQGAGLDLQADRLVFQSLKDPIMHLLRNAVSHGIEPPQQRKLKGKNETGLIEFHIEVKTNRLHITIADDGSGIDFSRVSDTAVKRKWLSAEEAETYNREALLKILFQPGFSTARMITDLSGRGIGLSVVKEALQRLQGDIDIRTQEHEGTRIALSVPLTITTHRLLVVKAGSQAFGIPATNIARLLRLEANEIETLENRPVIRFQGQLIPLFSLGHLLGIEDAALSLHRRRVPVAVLQTTDKRYYAAAAVREFFQETDTVIRELPPPVNNIPYFFGAFLQVDGTPALLLNPPFLVEQVKALDKTAAAPLAYKTEEVTAQQERSRILIVDDSITTRTLEKTILDAHGYDVFVAVDGLEALQFLQKNNVDLVITDIAMPRMTGFGLVEEMKKSDHLKHLPVIIVSSLDRKEDKEKGLSLGADAYIIKQKFEQQKLLETIRQII